MAASARSASPPPLRVDAEDKRISKMIQADLKAYWYNPENKVLNEPILAIVYSVGVKAISLFVALIFPFIAYTTFGLSIALIDRIAYNNFSLFFQGIINSCKGYINSRAMRIGDTIVDTICNAIASIPDIG
ncbi:MAG: hypothetical protein K1060chlam1_01035 [Candidatus Anoxychlamydiales bacterium]|nr:hypothetical protein [Candidatus Anoxychlamydiales bacterium]